MKIYFFKCSLHVLCLNGFGISMLFRKSRSILVLASQFVKMEVLKSLTISDMIVWSCSTVKSIPTWVTRYFSFNVNRNNAAALSVCSTDPIPISLSPASYSSLVSSSKSFVSCSEHDGKTSCVLKVPSVVEGVADFSRFASPPWMRDICDKIDEWFLNVCEQPSIKQNSGSAECASKCVPK